MTIKQAKRELAEAALQGINDYLRSTRGANMLPQARAYFVPGTIIIHVSARPEGELHYFDVITRESPSLARATETSK